MLGSTKGHQLEHPHQKTPKGKVRHSGLGIQAWGVFSIPLDTIPKNCFFVYICSQDKEIHISIKPYPHDVPTGWWLHHFSWAACSNALQAFPQKIPFLIAKINLSWHSVSSCPATCYLAKEANPHLATTPFPATEENNKVKPPFLQTEKLQLPQQLLTWLVL